MSLEHCKTFPSELPVVNSANAKCEVLVHLMGQQPCVLLSSGSCVILMFFTFLSFLKPLCINQTHLKLTLNGPLLILYLKIVHSIIYSENMSKLNLLRTNFSVRNRQVFDLYGSLPKIVKRK
jgi:hypothetical protein